MAAIAAPFPYPSLPKYPSLPRRNRHVSFCLTLDPIPAGSASSAPSSLPPPPLPSGLRAVITGGGSGGHVYPAIAIADEIRSAHPDAGILFVGTTDGMEANAVARAGYDYASVPAARLARPMILPWNLLLPFRLLRSVFASWRILRDFRPQVVVGTGGYVAAPVCLAAVLAGIKIVIQVFVATQALNPCHVLCTCLLFPCSPFFARWFE